MRYVDRSDITEIYRDIEDSMTERVMVATDGYGYYETVRNKGPESTCFYEAIKKYEDIRWNGGELTFTPMFSYTSTYRNMSEAQFAYYIAWRTNTLNGDVKYCDTSYFYTFVYELLAGFHGNNVEERYTLLKDTYLKFKQYDKTVEKYLSGWLLDFCIINNIFIEHHADLETILHTDKKIKEKQEKILNDDYTNCFDSVMAASSYKMDVRSTFFTTKKDAKLIRKVFDNAMFAINDCMKKHNLILSEFMIGKFGKARKTLYRATPWEYDVMNTPSCVKFREKFVLDDIVYEYDPKENVWHYDDIIKIGKISGGQDDESTSYYYHNGDFIGFLVRTIEDVCRKKAQYKHSLRPSYNKVYGTKRLNELADSGEIREVVEKVVDDYIANVGFEFVELPPPKPVPVPKEKPVIVPEVKSVDDIVFNTEFNMLDFSSDIHEYISHLSFSSRDKIEYIEPHTNITRFKKSEQEYAQLLEKLPVYDGKYDTDGILLEKFLVSKNAIDMNTLAKLAEKDNGYSLWIDLIKDGIITYPISSTYTILFMHQIGNKDLLPSKEWTLAVMIDLFNHYYPNFQHEEVLLWIRDYWITYCPDITYSEFKKMFAYEITFEGDSIQAAIHEIDYSPIDEDNYLEFFSLNSDYRMNTGLTVTEGNVELLNSCLKEVVAKLKLSFAMKGLVWDKFLQEVDIEIAEKRRDPFRRMVIAYDTLFVIAETFRNRAITEYENYSVEFDRVNRDMKYLITRKRRTYWKSRYFVECVGKLCELYVRNWLGLDAKFKVDLDRLSQYFPDLQMVIEDQSLLDTIKQAVETTCLANSIPKSVNSRDSIEHLINYAKEIKIIDDDAKSEFEAAMLYKKIRHEEIEKAREILLSNQEKLVIESEDEVEETVEVDGNDYYSEYQIHILKLLLDSEEGYNKALTYANQAGCNLVLEIEKINEIAMEDLGDVLVDDEGMGYFIYEDYIEYVEGL